MVSLHRLCVQGYVMVPLLPNLSLQLGYDVRGKIKAQVAVVAQHHLRCVPWPELLLIQLSDRIMQIFDECFGIGTEGTAFGDDRAKVQAIGKGREPFLARFVPVRASQLLQAHPEAMRHLHDPICALAEGRDQGPRAVCSTHCRSISPLSSR